MFRVLDHINRAIWGVPLLILILGVGLWISLKCGFPQLRLFPRAMRAFLQQFTKKKNDDAGSSYRALCTALAATVGTGNLAGVAGAIAIGGPGAVFWMWVCAVLGMATKFAEATLAVHYQNKSDPNTRYGGPMYMIVCGLHKRWHWMAYLYAFFGVVASFGVGNATQVNAVIGGFQSAAAMMGYEISGMGCVCIGVALAVLVLRILSGGAKRIGEATEKLVPIMSAGYLILGVVALSLKAEAIPRALSSIVTGAFKPEALTGGAVGSILTTLRIGASRGVFTNEAGMGTAAIAHGTSAVEHPVRQGLMGIIEVFLDTIVICTITALVILCSGIEIHYGVDTGIALTAEAFSAVCGDWVCIPISAALCCFAIATILGWGLYGASCAQFLFGKGAWRKFSGLQAIVIVTGALLSTATVWLLSDIVNGLMAIPNLIALLLLSPKLADLVNNYSKKHPARPGAENQILLSDTESSLTVMVNS